MTSDLTDTLPSEESVCETKGEDPSVSEDATLKAVKHVAYRIWRGFAECAVVVMTLGMAWLYGLSWLLTQQSVDVSGAKSNMGLLFADAVVGAGVDVPSMRLDWYPATDDIVFTGRDIIINTDDGTEIQKLEVLKSFFPLKDVQQGILLPRKVVLTGGVVSWVEDDQGRIRAGLGTPDTLGRLGPLWEGRRATNRRSGQLNLDGVQSVDINGATAFYINQVNGLSLSLREASVKFQNIDEKLFFDIGGKLKQSDAMNEAPVSLRVATEKAFENFDVTFETSDLNPSEVGPSKGRFRRVRDLNAATTVSGGFVFGREIGLQSAELTVDIGQGTIVVPFQDAPYAVEQFQASANLDSGDAIMQINRFDLLSEKLQFSSKGTLSELGAINDGDVNSSPYFDLDFQNLRADMRPVLAERLLLKGVGLSGRLDVDDRTLDVDKLSVDRETHKINADLYAKLNAEGRLVEIKTSGAMSGVMTAPELLDVWPVKFADGARRWIKRAVLAGDIDTFSFEADFADEGEGLSEKSMVVDYSVSDGTVKYISTMTPMTNVAGAAHIENNRLTATLSGGNIGPLTILPSQAEIPRLRPKGGDITLSIDAVGEASDMLSLLNQEPFQFADRYSVDPADIGGQGQIAVKITRPLLEFFDQKRIRYEVTGNFTEATAPFQIGRHKVSEGDVSLAVDTEGLKVTGLANIGPWRANLTWEETFDEGLTPTRYHVFGDMDHLVLDQFGVGGREFFDGIIGVDIRATGAGLTLNGGTLLADLKDTEITLGEYWIKQKGVAAEFKTSLRRDAMGTHMEAINIDAPDLNVLGNLSFTPSFALRQLSLDRVRVSDLVDGELVVRPDDTRELLTASFTGKRLDVSDFIDSSVSSQTSTFDVPVIFSGKVESLILDPLYETKNASILYSHNGEAMTSARLSADAEGGRVELDLITDLEKEQRRVLITLPSAELAAKAFLGINSVKEGRVNVTGTLPLPGQVGAYVGDVVIDDFTLTEAPVLAQLLSLGSLTGLFDTLSGEGLRFERLVMPFQLLEGVLSVRDARVYGPALGMSGEGNVDLVAKTVDIDGAIAPAYTANSFLGNLPLVGDIFGGKDGEGVFALSYTVQGPFEATQVAVNPLSALTPGFLRDIFRKDRDDIMTQEDSFESEADQ